MGCRGCAGTAGYLLRDCGSVGPQPLPMSFCCAVVIQSPHTLLKTAQGTCPRLCLRAKRPPECLPERLRHRKSRPAAQRSGGQEGDLRPGYPRRSGRPSERM